ncbi:MAG: hypothetical protein EBZ74_06990, partial [Planctomycetia bacterium]|nr:hypothetical protein [Planctomycetia bacterium]
APRATLWNPRDPAAVLRIVPPVRGVNWAQPATPLETARAAAGTLAVGAVIEAFVAAPGADGAAAATQRHVGRAPSSQAVWARVGLAGLAILAATLLLQVRAGGAAARRRRAGAVRATPSGPPSRGGR